jgi:hypothetical protein
VIRWCSLEIAFAGRPSPSVDLTVPATTSILRARIVRVGGTNYSLFRPPGRDWAMDLTMRAPLSLTSWEDVYDSKHNAGSAFDCRGHI